jgi:hypothetical protein
VSFPRTRETYRGFDICKLCTFLAFKKPKEMDEEPPAKAKAAS